MDAIKILLYLAISFPISIATMSITFYLHAKIIPSIDLDKTGDVYHKIVGPTMWLVIFASMVIK